MRMTRLLALGIGTLFPALLVAAPAQGQERVETIKRPQQAPNITPVTNQMLLNASKDRNNWLMFGRDYSNQRWSPLSQINTSNVKNLQVAWLYQTRISRLGTFETSPVVVNGVMYITTPFNTAMAVDARTGRELWRYEHKLATQIYCCGPANRGVAVSGTNVFMGTLDAHLVSLDAKTGNVNWDVQVADPEAGYSLTMAPLVVDSTVIIGISGGEYGIRGFVRAYNVSDGKEKWTFYTIPDKGWEGNFATTTPEGDNLHRDIAAEKAAMAQYANAWQHGGGGMWGTPSYDPDSKTLYFVVGNPSPDLDGSVRPGDNLYTDCVVAIDVTTGQYKWHYQQVPHDVWDLDATSPTILVKLKNGQLAVAEAGKTGYVYVLDAKTGKRIRRSQEFARHENYFAQPTAQGTRMLPGANGGSEWSTAAVNPNLGYMYVLNLEQPMNYFTHAAPLQVGQLWLGSAFKAVPGERQYGNFVAIDLNTGKQAWNVETEQPMMGGALATAGNLVFTGEGDGHFDAFDARSGKLLWSFQAGAGCNAPPVSYELNGKQYIAVGCGGNFQLGYPLGDAVMVFTLPSSGGAARSTR